MPFWLSVLGASPYRLKEGKDVVIGRDASCDLCLYSTMLSREHACIRWENGRPVLFDMDSLNGTFMGPDRIRRHQLRNGDVFRLGDIFLRFSDADVPPPPPMMSREDMEAGGMGELPISDGGETRPYSRTAALQQRLFDYDELGWLEERVGQRIDEVLALDPKHQEGVGAWWSGLQAEPEMLWEFLRLGIFVPLTAEVSLRGVTDPAEVAEKIRLTKRGQKLYAFLSGKRRTLWNEMASLRYQLRQRGVFPPLRMIARAYRPSGGLSALKAGELAYELEHVYAPQLTGPRLEQELRHLLMKGFLAPSPEATGEAWFPESWDGGAVVISRRGMALLEGFRLEED
jgi:FHA domain